MSITLDFASSILLVEMAGDESTARREVRLKGVPPHSIAARMEQLGVDLVICGAISRCLARDLEMRGIQIIAFVSGDAEEVIQAFSRGTLDNGKFLMAGRLPDARGTWRCHRRKGNPWRT